MKNVVIWIIGGSGVGKTTQAAMIHRYFISKFGKIFQILKSSDKEDYWCFTTLSAATSNLGRFIHPIVIDKNDKIDPKECCGTDTLSKKAYVKKSLKYAKNITPIVVIEGIMATGKWIDFIKDDGTYVFLFLLDCDNKSNFNRLRHRRANKENISTDEVEITLKTQENLAGKLNSFRSLYENVKDKCDYAMTIPTHHMSIDEIHNQIIHSLKKFSKVF